MIYFLSLWEYCSRVFALCIVYRPVTRGGEDPAKHFFVPLIKCVGRS